MLVNGLKVFHELWVHLYYKRMKSSKASFWFWYVLQLTFLAGRRFQWILYLLETFKSLKRSWFWQSIMFECYFKHWKCLCCCLPIFNVKVNANYFLVFFIHLKIAITFINYHVDLRFAYTLFLNFKIKTCRSEFS